MTKLDVESLAKYEHDMGAAQQLIRELRAENERLLGGWQFAESEIKRLLAEVERLKKLYDDVYAENQRLHAEQA